MTRTAPHRASGRPQPVEVALVAGNLPFVVRTFLGTAVLGIGANVFGSSSSRMSSRRSTRRRTDTSSP